MTIEELAAIGTEAGALLKARGETLAMLNGAVAPWKGGLFTASDARAEPWVAVPALAAVAEQMGVVIRESCAVRGLDLAAGKVAGVVTEVCVAFPALAALAEGFDVFVVTDASGTFNEITRNAAWDRMSTAGAQLMTWFGVAAELHRDWRNDIEGLGSLFSNHIPDYRNLMTAYETLTQKK